MKIIYTNLQEIDGSIKRKVRQLRVDFDGTGRGEAPLAHGGEGGRAGRDDSLLLCHADSFDLRRHRSQTAHAPCEGAEEDRERKKTLRREASSALEDAKSVAHLLVRRFIAAQMCSGHAVERRGRINVTV